VSAVLVGRNIDPWGAASDVPRMWINPWSPRPISETHSLPTTTANNSGEITSTEGTLAIHELFDLPKEWPQVDKPAP
jgi:hypothetical protein